MKRDIELQDTKIRVHVVILSETGYPDLQKFNSIDDDLYPDLPFTYDRILQIKPKLEYVVPKNMVGVGFKKRFFYSGLRIFTRCALAAP